MLTRAPTLVAAVALAAGAGCAQDAASPGAPSLAPVADGALAYLEVTRDEIGLDVVAALQIYAQARASARADALATRLAGGLRASDLERYGRLLSLDKSPFPAAWPDGVPSGAAPRPADAREDNLGVSCPLEALGCALADACRAYALEADRGGYVLTHQAVLLLFWRWAGCAPDGALEERRRPIGARLLEEAAADPARGDLFLERLAMIGHLGFAARIERRWLAELAAMQRPEGCFPASPSVPCHPHPTGLALWTLADVP